MEIPPTRNQIRRRLGLPEAKNNRSKNNRSLRGNGARGKKRGTGSTPGERGRFPGGRTPSSINKSAADSGDQVAMARAEAEFRKAPTHHDPRGPRTLAGPQPFGVGNIYSGFGRKWDWEEYKDDPSVIEEGQWEEEPASEDRFLMRLINLAGEGISGFKSWLANTGDGASPQRDTSLERKVPRQPETPQDDVLPPAKTPGKDEAPVPEKKPGDVAATDGLARSGGWEKGEPGSAGYGYRLPVKADETLKPKPRDLRNRFQRLSQEERDIVFARMAGLFDESGEPDPEAWIAHRDDKLQELEDRRGRRGRPGQRRDERPLTRSERKRDFDLREKYLDPFDFRTDPYELPFLRPAIPGLDGDKLQRYRTTKDPKIVRDYAILAADSSDPRTMDRRFTLPSLRPGEDERNYDTGEKPYFQDPGFGTPWRKDDPRGLHGRVLSGPLDTSTRVALTRMLPGQQVTVDPANPGMTPEDLRRMRSLGIDIRYGSARRKPAFPRGETFAKRRLPGGSEKDRLARLAKKYNITKDIVKDPIEFVRTAQQGAIQNKMHIGKVINRALLENQKQAGLNRMKEGAGEGVDLKKVAGAAMDIINNSNDYGEQTAAITAIVKVADAMAKAGDLSLRHQALLKPAITMLTGAWKIIGDPLQAPGSPAYDQALEILAIAMKQLEGIFEGPERQGGQEQQFTADQVEEINNMKPTEFPAGGLKNLVPGNVYEMPNGTFMYIDENGRSYPLPLKENNAPANAK